MMPLVNYSSSDDAESCSEDTDTKQKRWSPPLKKTKTQNETTTDTNALGRIRSFAHERGNWATFIYLPFRFNDSILELQSQITNNLEKDLNVKFHFIQSLHISLSRTVVLQHHWIDAFTKSIKESVCDLKRFTLNLNSLNVYCNDECTTTFVAVAVPEMASEVLKSLVTKLNNCLSEYNLPLFYEEPSFHISILWCVGNQKEKILTQIEILQQILDESIQDDYRDYQIIVNQIECKVGNKIFTYPLLS